MLDARPEWLEARDEPYAWTLLHAAAQNGHLAVVDLLLKRGLDVNARESGDNTGAIHWAAAAGHLAVVERLVEAGADVVGSGDDHALEVIGWATCWDGCGDEAHRAIVALLTRRGARHHIFSAVAMDLADEVRRIVASVPGALSRRMSRNESHQMPLHFAVRMRRPNMVALLLELGADPLGVDGSGHGADPNARWSHWDAEVTPLHLAALGGHAEVVRALVGAGADPRIRDSVHDSDPIGWAEFFRKPEIVTMLEGAAPGPGR
jgi:cytohesin